jgi:hypothetical protein
MSHLAFFGFPKLKFIVPPKFTIRQQHASYMCDHAKKTHPKEFFKIRPFPFSFGAWETCWLLEHNKISKNAKKLSI